MIRRAALAMPLAALVAACGVNAVPTAQETAKARWADVQNQYQRRADLIPNLVATVKAAGAQEKDILVGVAQARAQATQIHVSPDELTDPAKVQAYERAQTNVTTSLQRLQEAYPDLKSQGNYSTLMAQLEGTETRIEIARNDYNSAVQAYNTTIRTFPDAIGAKLIYGAKPMTPFQATSPNAEVAPTVNFGNGELARVLRRALAWLLLLVAAPAAAQTFPPFTGFVVDAAHVLPAQTQADLTAKLQALRHDTKRQLVVATVPDLQGYPIEEYGYRLGRSWGVGLRDVNNGAILLVAPTERKVRIEVGSGLEPILTDAFSNQVIEEQIVPRFKAGDLPGGVSAGAEALIAQLRAAPEEQQARTDAATAAYNKAHAARASGGGEGVPIGLIFWGVVLVFFVLPAFWRRGGGGSRWAGGGGGGWPILLWSLADDVARGSGGGWSGGGSSSGGGSGSDSSWTGDFGGGGGGSFGGGGASGSW